MRYLAIAAVLAALCGTVCCRRMNGIGIGGRLSGEAAHNIAKLISVYRNASSNYQIASLAYQSDNVALLGMANLMKEHGNKKEAMAIKLMQYNTKRGGPGNMDLSFRQDRQAWCFSGMFCNSEYEDAGNDIMKGLTNAMELEEHVYSTLIAMFEVASEMREFHFAFFIQSELMDEVLNSIHELSVITTRFRRIAEGPGSGQGIHMFDMDLLEGHEVHLL